VGRHRPVVPTSPPVSPCARAPSRRT
jgi:hypothetical protein